MDIPDNDLLPFCGDGFTDANEQCDEGLNNGVAGSYCSDQCVNLGEQQHPAIADTGRTDDFEITTPIAGETVVTDLVTNLMWQQMTSNSSSLWQGAFDYCENLTYAGFNDWHLPTPHEISSLVDYGISHSALYEPISSSMGWDNGNLLSALVYLPTINDDYNLNTWFFQLYNSRVFPSWGGGLDDTAICVRRLAETYPLAVRYEEQAGSDSKIVVKDNRTNLYWTKEDFGPADFDTAQTICADLNYGDYDDWEAPSVVDLLSLIDYSHYDPASTFPGISSNVFWTNLTDSYHTNYQWYVDMMSGTLDYQPTENYFVRCVRR